VKNAILEREVIRRAHIHSVREAMPDGRVHALFANRDSYIRQSSETIGRLAAHPPVPNHKALVPCPSPAVTPLAEKAYSPKAPAAESYLPDAYYDQDMQDGYAMKYGAI
jgi:hypothetical protein